MPEIRIPHRWKDVPCWAGDAFDLKDATIKAVKSGTNLSGADLGGANLRGTNLRGAILRGAILRGADLGGADLLPIKHDFIAAILYLPDEIPFLRQTLIDGKIDGSTYNGECACLAGTMAQACHQEFDDFQAAERMPIDSNSPREIWFTAIRPGDTPENNGAAKITLEWIDEALEMVARIRGTK